MPVASVVAAARERGMLVAVVVPAVVVLAAVAVVFAVAGAVVTAFAMPLSWAAYSERSGDFAWACSHAVVPT